MYTGLLLRPPPRLLLRAVHALRIPKCDPLPLRHLQKRNRVLQPNRNVLLQPHADPRGRLEFLRRGRHTLRPRMALRHPTRPRRPPHRVHHRIRIVLHSHRSPLPFFRLCTGGYLPLWTPLRLREFTTGGIGFLSRGISERVGDGGDREGGRCDQ